MDIATKTLVDPNMNWLDELLSKKIIRPIDKSFAQFIAAQHFNATRRACDDDLLLLVVLLSQALGQNHSCLDLHKIDVHSPFGSVDVVLPNLTHVAHKFNDFHGLTVIADVVDINNSRPLTPLVLYNNHLYLQRYWNYQLDLAQVLKQKSLSGLSENQNVTLPLRELNQWFNSLFSTSNASGSSELDWQKAACASALLNDFSVITGGPGTGKTTTVTNLLALLVLMAEHNQVGAQPIIKLVTPTGKAAARLSESIKGAKSRLGLDKIIIEQIPDTASTIHRLLGVKPFSSEFIHHKDNLLHLDVLVVDEVSMVDLPMMAKLVSALPPKCKLILLGDKDQLASVEAGSVLADICAPLNQQNQTNNGVIYSHKMVETIKAMTGMDISNHCQIVPTQDLNDSLSLLQVSYRFDDKSGIGQLAKAVNRGDVHGVMALKRQDDDSLHFAGVDDIERQKLIERCAKAYQPYIQMMNDGADAKSIIEQFNRFQLLCALREGDFGVSGLNKAIEQQLVKWKLIDNTHLYYAGKPIMVSTNDYSLQLYNGDVGLLLPDKDTHQLKAWFVTPDGEVKAVFPNRLPNHQAVYAMTVHKSQGSEFEHVAFVLPPAKQVKNNQVINKELVYTGITRAKKRFDIYSEDEVLNMAIKQTTQRSSGLGGLLYGEECR